MSFYNKDTEIIDLTIDSDHNSSPLSPPPSPELFSSNVNSQSNDVTNYKYKMMTRKPRNFIEEEEPRKSQTFIVDDYEIEEETAVAAEKYPDNKYDIKWDNELETDNNWEADSWKTTQTVDDMLLSTFMGDWGRMRKSPKHLSTHYNGKDYNKETIDKFPNVDWNERIDDIEIFDFNEADQLIVNVLWESGLRSAHLLDELHEKVPKRMCQWYSTHLRFSDEN